MIESPQNIKQIRNSLKKMAVIQAIPLKLKRTRLGSGVSELMVSAPSPFPTNCVATIILDKEENFVEAVVVEPGRWHHCISEGLTSDQAYEEANRFVDTLGDVMKYLMRMPYEWDGKKKWMARVTKA